MASKGNWAVVMDDKKITKNYAEGASEGIAFIINDDAFWNDAKFSNIWAIQYGTSVSSDEVEYRDTTPHTSYADANLGDISQFSSRWDTMYLAKIQSDWDNNILYDSENNVVSETEAEKIARLGARPTSYSS
jgi:hypothetical protein|tara:strand:- start:2831 stop:3226 length:396 start_codon:yes stop_codon:yes gene_type:complete